MRPIDKSDRKDSHTKSKSRLIFKNDFGQSWGVTATWNFSRNENKVCYTVENVFLSIVAYSFFSPKSSNFAPALALFALQCEMIVKPPDSVRSSILCRSEG